MWELYYPVITQVAVAVALALIVIIASHIFGQRANTNVTKDTAYECGLLPEPRSTTRFGVKFYVVAMLFILFDIEIVFLVPWTLVYREFVRDLGMASALLPALFFGGVLVVGLVYELRKGGLKWER